MSIGRRRWTKTFVALVTTIGVVGAGLAFAAAPATADTNPPVGLPDTVTSVPLPTAQINGVAWTQAIVGNTVFVGGEFTNARPAGAAAGVNTSPRSNLMSYNLTTGAMTGWNPGANGVIRAITASPDGSRIYVGGTFTTIAGAARNRIAAFDAASGALLAWNPGANAGVIDIATSGNTVYVGGSFSSVAGGARTRVAAVNATTGALLPFTATLAGGNGVRSIVVSPTGDKVVVGGSFVSTNGNTNPGRGLAALNAVTGASMEWKVNSLIRNADLNSAIYSLASDGDSVYGVGYDYYGGEEDNFEGTFRASWSDGTLVWLEDCHGDNYSVAVNSGVVYTASHDHYCGNVGGFPQTSPNWNFNHSLAFAKEYLGDTVGPDPLGYKSYAGQPAGRLLHWFPTWQVGTFTGAKQAGWDVAATDNYVVYGGEFKGVNNVQQEGLVRFAKKVVAPDTDGPQLSGAGFPVTPLSLRAGEVRLSWGANTDRDNATLTYQLFRQDKGATPIFTTTADSNFWTKPDLKFVDTTVTPGTTYQYRVRAIDPNGNAATGAYASITATTTPASDYSLGVLDDGAVNYWPLGEPSGTVGANWAQGGDVTVNGATRGQTGPNIATANKATSFDGTTASYAATRTRETAPDTVSMEAWFKTTSTAGGKILGFGDATTGNSSNYDRQLYLDGSGRLTFGVHPGGVRTLETASGLNDGQWHHVVGTLGASGMTLYVDGQRAGSRVDTVSGQPYSGYWRIGGDNLGGWPNVGSSTYLNGTISDVAIYDKVLTRQQIDAHWTKSGRASTIPSAPADAYGKAVFDLAPMLFWRLGESSGATAADSGPDAAAGTYFGDVTKGTAGALKDVANSAITTNPNGGTQTGVSSNKQYSNPTTFAVETWFRTDSTTGGKIVGFGNAQTGASASYDRHIYMSGDGRVKFGTYTGQLNIVESSPGYNDGSWHHVVGQMSPTGMQLYIDGSLVGTNPNTGAQDYSGYWRVGGDNGWEGDQYWRGSVDEVAVYPSALTSAQVNEHFDLGKLGVVNQAPVAAFSSIITDLSVAFDGTGSSDADGTIASHAWTFGDGSTSTEAAPTHVYATSGTFNVTLTVTDQLGKSSSITQSATVVGPNVAPTSSFTSSVAHMSASFDGTSSADSDGTITSYAWAFGDGSTATGATAAHLYPTAGTWTVTLTVTDDRGDSVSSEQNVVTTVAPGAPGDAYGAAVYNLSPTLYWRLGESSGSVVRDSGVKDNPGQYFGNVSKGEAGALTGVSNTAVSLNPNGGDQTGVSSDERFSNPTTFAVETWFKTDTTSGGKLIGLGDARTGTSNNYDRHLYMSPDGRVKFGVWTGSAQVVQSNTGLNDNKWHYVVAQLSSAGMQLYVDGVLVDGNSNTAAQDYSGYWRVGGDTGWEGDTYWRGAIDEVAVYPAALTAGQVADHFELGQAGVVNEPPTAAFSSSVSGTTVTLDGSASTDLDGPIVSYAWNFGDGTPAGAGVTLSHPYAAPGNYSVVLTVTDAQGMTDTVAKEVVIVAPNELPTAAFTTTVQDLALAADGTGSTDPDGAIVSYAWSFGDGGTSTQAAPVHTYEQPGDYTVELTVTDDQGGQSTLSKIVSATSANQPPTAAFTSAVTGLTVSVDGSSSTDADGTVASYAWAFGDGTTKTGSTASHTYAAADTYTVTLTVTDDKGATNVKSAQVTVTAPNAAPVAAFTSTVSNLTVSVDGSSSTDADGAVASYSWSFGDGTSKAGPTASHTYATPDTYTVTLTVTDDKGATNVKSAQVTVTAPPATSNVIASDSFQRTGTNGWGSADKGGAWAVTGSASRYSVAGGSGVILVANSTFAQANLTAVSSASTRVTASFSVDKLANGQYVTLIGRQVDANQYLLRGRIGSDGSIQLQLLRNAVAVGSGYTVPGVTIAPGAYYNLAFEVKGTSPTSLSGKVWPVGGAEPASWQVARTDATAGFQVAGSVGLTTFVPTSANAYPVKVAVSDFTVTDPTITTPPPPANAAPVAGFTSSVSGLTASVDGSSSTDADGTIAAYAWAFGDGATASGVTASHPYAAAGTYTVTLTVTDNAGATNVKTGQVTVTAPPPANAAPVAGFTSSVSGLTASVDGSSSTDADGTIAAYAWAFGDGATASGVTASHPYAAAGTYMVTLTVTDNAGATNVKTGQVTVTAPPPPAGNVLARDLFERTGSNGWGTADQGGAWTVTGTASRYSVAGGAGVITLPNSTAAQTNLLSVSSANTKVAATFSVDKIANGQYVTVIGRQVGADQYLLRARIAGDGTVQLNILRNQVAVGGGITVPGVVVTPGAAYTVVFEVRGTAPTTLSGKLWATGQPEPAAWQVTRTDATAGPLQAAGSVGLTSYVPAAAAVHPVTLSIAELTITDPTIP